ncbi:MAG: NAD(P)H-quinone oxidoreductase [Acidobacteria bacterium]|nr:MAG: NAD(P)H-quinone oxidoreductase [Acidobacteriota bacterium]
MLAVLPFDPSAGPTPRLGELPEPVAGPGEVLVRVRATALNRADLLQMRGLYPPPPGESEVPGLECAGEVAALGDGVADWRIGERVMALLAGGGHAERVAVPAGQLMRIPGRLTWEQAAALPEAALTSWTNLRVEGGLEAGQSVLITAAASGVGTFAVQLARELGARVLVAGRDPERLERLRPLGAEHCLPLDDELTRRAREAAGGDGVDLVLDLAGGNWLPAALAALRPRGRLVLVGILAGARAEIDLADVLRRRLQLVGSVLRARSRAEKAELVAGFMSFAGPRLAAGALRPVIDRVMPFSRIAEAYATMARGGLFGKLVLRLDG